MPFSGPNDDALPSNVADKPQSVRARYVRVWNGTYASCQREDASAQECETLAFQVANAQLAEDKANGQRAVIKAMGDLMLVITSNSYQDREKEWLTTKALSEWVDSQWDGDKFIGNDPLLYNHRGLTIGHIIWADMFGPFLVEMARKRRSEVPAFQQYIDKTWGRVGRNPKGWGASHGFYSRKRSRDSDGIVHHVIDKRETTVLRRVFAANVLTLAKVI